MSPYKDFLNGNGHSNGNGHFNGNGNNPEHLQKYTQRQGYEDDDTLDLKNIFYTLLGYKWVILAVLIAGTAIAYFYATNLPPTYQTSGTLMIQEEQNQYRMAGSDIGDLMTSRFGVGMGNSKANEIAVIESRSFSQEVAERLMENPEQEDGEVYPILWEKYPEDSEMVDAATAANRIRSNLEIELLEEGSDILQISFRSESPHEAQAVVDNVIENYHEYSREAERQQAGSALEFLSEEEQRIEQRLQESENQLSEFMSSERVINVDQQASEEITRIATLEAELETATVERQAVEEAIRRHENELESIRPGLDEMLSRGISQNLTYLQQQLAELRTERSLLISRNPDLKDNPEAEPSLVEKERQINAMQEEIRELTSELTDSETDHYLGFLGSEDGNVIERVNELRSNLIELNVEASQYEARQRVVEERLDEHEEFFASLPDKQRQMSQLKRNVEMNSQIYSTISQQASEMELWEQTQMGMGRTVDMAALPEAPVSPRVPLYVLIGFMLSGVLSVGGVMLREGFKKEVDSVEKMRNYGGNLLSVIPDTKKEIRVNFNKAKILKVGNNKVSTDVIAMLDSISPTTEAYRRLHTNIVYSQPDQPFQTLMVTSSNKSEGKSTVAANLAVTMTEAGKNVILLDTDLRRPRMSRMFGLSREPGVMDLMFDEETKLEDLIQSTPVEGLDLLSAGKKAPNPAAVSRSNKMHNLLAELKKKYDHIILDTPPFGLMTDAAPLVRYMDGVLLVVRFNQTTNNELQHTTEHLHQVRANVIGSVFTAYNSSKAYGDYGSYNYTNYYDYAGYQYYQTEK